MHVARCIMFAAIAWVSMVDVAIGATSERHEFFDLLKALGPVLKQKDNMKKFMDSVVNSPELGGFLQLFKDREYLDCIQQKQIRFSRCSNCPV